MTNCDSLRRSVTTAYGSRTTRTKRPRHGVASTRPGSDRKIDPVEGDPVATQHTSSALRAPARSAAYPMAKPGYGKRSAPNQLPRTRADFALLPARERYVAGFVDHLPEGAAMSVKQLAKQLPLYGQQAISSALTALSVAGHLRRVRCALGAGDETRWVFRTFWSRTAHDNEWWQAYLTAENTTQADSSAPDTPAPDTAPPSWVPDEEPPPPASEEPGTEQGPEPTPVPHQRTPDQAPDTQPVPPAPAPHPSEAGPSPCLPRPGPPRPRGPPPPPLRRRLRRTRTTGSGVAHQGRQRRLPDHRPHRRTPRPGRHPPWLRPPPPHRQDPRPGSPRPRALHPAPPAPPHTRRILMECTDCGRPGQPEARLPQRPLPPLPHHPPTRHRSGPDPPHRHRRRQGTHEQPTRPPQNRLRPTIGGSARASPPDDRSH
ncbi:hypothetical protein SMICM304S_12063 [Streptomyces microflavus]